MNIPGRIKKIFANIDQEYSLHISEHSGMNIGIGILQNELPRKFTRNLIYF